MDELVLDGLTSTMLHGSPDLQILQAQIFLWGFPKNTVFVKAPTIRVTIFDQIGIACRSMPWYVFLSTLQNFVRMRELFIDTHGGIFCWFLILHYLSFLAWQVFFECYLY